MEFIVRYISCSSQSGRQSWRMSLGKSRNHGSCKDSGSRNQWTHRWSFQGVTIRMEHPQLSSVLVFRWPGVPGASVQNSAHGKGHEEGGLAYAKAWSSLRKPPVPKHLTPKPESVLCSHLHLWLYGGLSPITVSLGEGVNVQLQGNKNSWAWQECFSFTDSSEGYLAHLYRFVRPHVIVYSLLIWEAWRVLDLLKANSLGELEIISIVGWLEIILVKGFSFVVSIIAANSLLWVGQGCLRSNLSADRLACVTGLSILLTHDCLLHLNHKQHREFWSTLRVLISIGLLLLVESMIAARPPYPWAPGNILINVFGI